MNDRPRQCLVVGQIIKLEDTCLHCAVMKVIEAAYPNGAIDCETVINQLGDVIAEALASHPDRNMRRKWTKLAVDWIEKRVPEKRAGGDYFGAARRDGSVH